MIADGAQVPEYRLPDPLIFADGSPVTTPADWRARRDEIIALFAAHVYGVTPQIDTALDATVIEPDTPALTAAVVRRQTRLRLTLTTGALDVDLLSYRPKRCEDKLPTIIIPNFRGNHTVEADPAIVIRVPPSTPYADQSNERGAMARRFPVEAIAERGYQLVTFCYADVAPDVDDLGDGAHPLFAGGERSRSPLTWGAVGAWAWGMSRVLDHLLGDPLVDDKSIFAAGHSRLGKAALWAAAQDERFGGVFANNSGCTGAAISRRRFGETVEAINALFPHWFCRRYRTYGGCEDSLPIDQHELIAAIAPRSVYIASASDDLWGDPHGTFLALVHADPVYRLLGVEGFTNRHWPPATASSGRVGFHLRAGRHDLLAADWQVFLGFIERRTPDF